jgi:ATP-dependent helicase/nuclease subunit A
MRSPLAHSEGLGYRRGALIHRLLQSLPALPTNLRDRRARSYLAFKGHGLSLGEQDDMARTVMRLIDDRAFSAVFAEGSMAETPIIARVNIAGTIVPINGIVDRLFIGPQEVLILDFKSNRPPPAGIDDVDPSYVRQLALYRRAMLQLFPCRAVRAALLWTEGPKMMELPVALMETCLA